MRELLEHIKIQVNDKTYIKDPDSSELGRSIIREGNLMIHDMGIEAFTFKKLAIKLNTTESTIYRYFENKHKLLVYLISWYWGWLEYELVLNSSNISNSEDRLVKLLNTICNPLKVDISHEQMNLRPLHNIVVNESPKAYYTKDAVVENGSGLFSNYKRVVERLALAIADVNPKYPYNHSMASVAIESINQQQFLAAYYPQLSDVKDDKSALCEFIVNLVLNTIKK
jgi:AcrR family transcriptional regulator